MDVNTLQAQFYIAVRLAGFAPVDDIAKALTAIFNRTFVPAEPPPGRARNKALRAQASLTGTPPRPEAKTDFGYSRDGYLWIVRAALPGFKGMPAWTRTTIEAMFDPSQTLAEKLNGFASDETRFAAWRSGTLRLFSEHPLERDFFDGVLDGKSVSNVRCLGRPWVRVKNGVIHIGLDEADPSTPHDVASAEPERGAEIPINAADSDRSPALGGFQVAAGIRKVPRAARERQLEAVDVDGVPLFRDRLLGQSVKYVSLPDRLLLTGVAGAGKTTTAVLLLSDDERDLIVIEPTAERSDAVRYASMELPMLIENIGADDVRFVERVTALLPHDVPLIVTSRSEVVLEEFEHHRVPDSNPRSFIDDVVDHCAKHFGVPPLDWPQHTRTVDRVERERPETILSIFEYVARELGHRLPHDPEPHVAQWRRRIPAPDTDSWGVLLAIATVATAHHENEVVPRQVIERYCAFVGVSRLVIDRLRHEGWINVAGEELYLPTIQLDSLREAMWDADAYETRPTVVRWLATVEDAGIPRDDHERLLKGFWSYVSMPVHYDELTGVREQRDRYRDEMCRLLALRLYTTYEHPPWWMIVALADAGRFDLVMALSDDDLGHDWGRLMHPARKDACFEALFERAMRDRREVNYLARAAVRLAIEEGNLGVADAALRVIREHGGAQDLSEWEAFVEQELAALKKA